MTTFEQKTLGKTEISAKSIRQLQEMRLSLREDLKDILCKYCDSEKSPLDVIEFNDAWKVITYQDKVAEFKINVIVRELKLRSIEVRL